MLNHWLSSEDLAAAATEKDEALGTGSLVRVEEEDEKNTA